MKVNDCRYVRPRYSAAKIAFRGINISKSLQFSIKNSESVEKFDVYYAASCLLRKFKGFLCGHVEEMPTFKKPMLGKMETSEKMRKELEAKARESVIVNSHKREAEQALKDARCTIENGDIDSNGHLTMAGKDKIERAKNSPAFKSLSEDEASVTPNSIDSGLESGSVEHFNLDYDLSDELPSITKSAGERISSIGNHQIFDNIGAELGIDNIGDIASHSSDIAVEKIVALKPNLLDAGDGILSKIDHIIDSVIEKIPGQ